MYFKHSVRVGQVWEYKGVQDTIVNAENLVECKKVPREYINYFIRQSLRLGSPVKES